LWRKLVPGHPAADAISLKESDQECPGKGVEIKYRVTGGEK
jgi:hypothetical protein